MFRRLTVSLLAAAGLLLAAPLASADSIHGTCRWSGGSKCDGAVGISTSWNGKKAYPKNGRYTLDFGKTVDHRITVYCNGDTVGTVYVKGSTRFDVVCR